MGASVWLCVEAIQIIQGNLVGSGARRLSADIVVHPEKYLQHIPPRSSIFNHPCVSDRDPVHKEYQIVPEMFSRTIYKSKDVNHPKDRKAYWGYIPVAASDLISIVERFSASGFCNWDRESYHERYWVHLTVR